MKIGFASLVLMATSALVSPQVAFAQDAAVAEEDQGGLEEIVVTAQKREEGLSDVPISIAAVSGKTLENYGQSNLEAASSSIPNLKITQTAIANRIAIRGIASGDNKGFEQSVAMFVDGIYYGRDQLSRMPLVDLQRIEVLRGPQPTLFGKNAIAGAVNVVSRKPGRDFEGSLSAGYEFNHDEARLTGVISAPLSDSVGARVVGYYRSMKGYFFNTKQDRREPNVREAFGRGTLAFDGGGPLTADIKLEYADFKTKGQPREPFGPVGIYSAVFAGPLFVDTREDWVRSDGGYESRNKIFNSVLTANLELGEHTLTSITGYLDYNTKETIDVDFVQPVLLDGTRQTEDYRQISQELRLASPGDQPFNYIAGVYYQNTKLDVTDNVQFNPFFFANAAFRPIGDTTNERDYSQNSDLISVFAQAEFALAETLRLTFGARYNHESKDGSRTLVINRGPLNRAALPAITDAQVVGAFRFLNIEAHTISGKLSEDSFNPMANVQWDITDDLMAYASFARGTKAGGFDIRSNSLPTSTTIRVPRSGAFLFGDERADNWEGGFKYKTRNLAFNISYYRTTYKDLQTNVFDGVLNFNVQNAAGARTQGVEADFRWAVDSHLTLSGAIAYLDFKFTDFTKGQCYFQQTPGSNGFCDYTGKRNALTPKWSGNLNFDWTHEVGSALKLDANLNFDFSDSYLAGANLDPRSFQEGYIKVGARLAIGAEDGQWTLALVGRNLLNERIKQTVGALPLATTFTGGRGVAYSAIYDRPRNVAVQADFKF